MAKNEDALKEYGVEINDSNGQLRSTYDILVDLAPKWKTMTEAQKVSLGTTLAGVNQYKVFAAVMNNFDQAINATNDSLNSTGATARQNAIYMESLEAKVQALKTEFEKLVIGNGGMQSFAKTIVSIGTSILKFANSDIGQLVIKFALLETSALLIVKNFTAISMAIKNLGIVRLISDISMLNSGMATVVSSQLAMDIATKGLTKAFIENAIAWAMTPMGMATIAVASTVAIIAVIEKLNVTLDEQVEKLNEAKSAYESSQSEVESLTSRLKEVRDRINEISSSELNITNNEELKLLKEEEATLKRQLDLKKEIAEQEKETYTREAEKTLKTKTKDAGAFGYNSLKDVDFVPSLVLGLASTTETQTNSGTVVEALAEYTKQIETTQQKIDNLIAERDRLIQQYGEESSQVKSTEETLNTLINKRDSARTSASEYAQIIEDATNGANQENETIKEAVGVLDEYCTLIGEVRDSEVGLTDDTKEYIDTLGEEMGLTEEEIDLLQEKVREALESGEELDDIDLESLIDGIIQARDATEEAIDVTERYNQALSNLQGLSSAFSTLSDAIAEFNNTGELSIDTLFSILSLSDEYLAVLSMENGQLSINEGMLQQLVNARINEAEAAAVEATQANLAKIAQGEYNGVLRESSTASNTSVNAASRAGQAIIASGNQATRAASMWASAWSTIANGYTFKTTSQKSAAKQEETALKNKITSYETLRKSLLNNTKAVSSGTYATKANTGAKGGNTKATKSNTDAQKANTEALQAQQKALQEEIDIYEKVISYIKDKVNDYIDELEDARDKEIDLIDEQIDKLKEQQDAEEEYWDEKINALKAQNEELESQIELEELLSNLQKAKQKKVKVYKEGKGFVYTSDQGAVSEAQQALDDYYRKKKYEEQLKQLEDFKDKAKANYDKQIDDLKDKQKRIKEQYQKEIDYYKQWLKNFQDQIDAYEKAQLRQQAIQLTGIDFEKQGWQTRLNNLGSFISAYNAKVQEMEELKKRLDAASTSSGDGGDGGGDGGGGGTYYGSSSSGSPSSAIGDSVDKNKPSSAISNTNHGYFVYSSRHTTQASATEAAKKLRDGVVKHVGNYWYAGTSSNIHTGLTSAQASSKASQVAPSVGGKVVSWATGTKSVKDDQVAIVGEDPNKELVIGSKLNGQMMNLKKGTGVVNAKSTNTLAGILNQLGSMSYGNFGGGGTLAENTNNQSVTQHFSFGNISLPNVTDADSFVKELSIKFNSYAIQHGNARV